MDKDTIKDKVFNLLAFGDIPTDTNVKEGAESLKVQEELQQKFGFPGVIMFGSKSDGTAHAKKKDIVFVPNGNIFLDGGYKVWFGDILTNAKTLQSLKAVSVQVQRPLYILREHDGRFLKEVPDNAYLEERYCIKIDREEVIVKESASR